MVDNEILIKSENIEQREEELVKNNMGLVIGIAKRFVKRGYEMDDLLQIGSVGLIKAIRKFDTSYDVKFSTYAVPLIFGEIRRFIRDDGIIKVSRKHKTNAMKLYTAKERLLQTMDKEPTISEIAKECGISVDDAIVAMEATNHPESLFLTDREDGNDKELIDKIGTVSEEKNILNRVVIKESLKQLTEREKKVIELRYFCDKTQSSVAKIIGVSQVQVSRIEKKALMKMRSYLGE